MHYTVSDILLDLLQNSVEAQADTIRLAFKETEKEITVVIKDNGCGMTEEELQLARDPFYTDGKKHAGRDVGLGIPFLVQTAVQTDGEVVLTSEKGRGTEVKIRLDKTHWDCPPLGDLPSLFMQAMNFDGKYELVVERVYGNSDRYSLSRRELMEVLGDFNQADTLILFRDYLRSQETELNRGM